MIKGEEEEVRDEEDEDAERRQERSCWHKPPTEKEKKLIKKVHVNMGHPENSRFLRVMRAAGTKPHLLRWMRDEFTCAQCAARGRIRHRRKAALPRTFRFNHIVAVDSFKIDCMGEARHFLNIVDHSSNLQVVMALRDQSAKTAWRAFQAGWMRPYGAAQIFISDGGPEFGGRFAWGVEQWGILHHVTNAVSPWENGRCERHGGWIKE